MSTTRAASFPLLTWLSHIGCCFACCLSAAFSIAAAPATKHLYVERFTTKAGSETLQREVISELQKIASISLVSQEADADYVVEGGGEIWVRGYKSLNPRSGRLPSDGVPVYGGYLSIELLDSRGQTVWSDLVTPANGSANVPRELARRIAKDVAIALEGGEGLSKVTALPQPAMVLNGAGATFPSPVYAKWFKNYRRDNPSVEIHYDAIGSELGIRRLLAGSVDFGASDNPEAIREIAPAQQDKYLLFPSVVGAVVPIVNLPGLSGDISFTPETLAAIYLGKIRKWNDPLLREANHGRRLPDLDIVVIHREDGSGTSYAWTDYLSKTSASWKADVGSSLAPKWPVGKAASGNDGVAKMVKELGGGIGYVEFIYALQNHMNFGRIRNRNGDFVAASLESISAAVRQSAQTGDDFKASIVDAPGQGAYPIASFTWLVVPARFSSGVRRDAMRSFLHWMLGQGQRQAAALGYLALPEDLVSREAAAIDKLN